MLLTSYLVLSNTLYMVFIGWILLSMMRGRLQVLYTPATRIADIHELPDDEDVEKQLTEQELEQLRWGMDFDQRIASMKEEVAQHVPYTERKGFTAEESDGVTNLPHDAAVIPRRASQLEIAD